MICPRCRSAHFQPSPELRRPLVNLGGKETFDTVAIRRYVCVCCGFAFKTEEKYSAEIVTTKADGAAARLAA